MSNIYYLFVRLDVKIHFVSKYCCHVCWNITWSLRVEISLLSEITQTSKRLKQFYIGNILVTQLVGGLNNNVLVQYVLFLKPWISTRSSPLHCLRFSGIRFVGWSSRWLQRPSSEWQIIPETICMFVKSVKRVPNQSNYERQNFQQLVSKSVFAYLRNSATTNMRGFMKKNFLKLHLLEKAAKMIF